MIVQKYVVRAEQERTATEAKRKRQELELLAAAKAKAAAKLREVRIAAFSHLYNNEVNRISDAGCPSMLVLSTM